jgi:hypothetical protein
VLLFSAGAFLMYRHHVNTFDSKFDYACGFSKALRLRYQNSGRLENKVLMQNAKLTKESFEGQLIDPWGHPYLALDLDPTKIYSTGPNGIDENTQGDDVYCH